MASNTISDMQKHIDDYRYDIAMVKRRSLEAGPLGKVCTTPANARVDGQTAIQ